MLCSVLAASLGEPSCTSLLSAKVCAANSAPSLNRAIRGVLSIPSKSRPTLTSGSWDRCGLQCGGEAAAATKESQPMGGVPSKLYILDMGSHSRNVRVNCGKALVQRCAGLSIFRSSIRRGPIALLAARPCSLPENCRRLALRVREGHGMFRVL